LPLSVDIPLVKKFARKVMRRVYYLLIEQDPLQLDLAISCHQFPILHLQDFGGMVAWTSCHDP
jgi:hypothetical protein